MQFAFTDEQEFRAILRRFLEDRSPTTEVRRLMATDEGYDKQVWQQLSRDLGLPGVHIRVDVQPLRQMNGHASFNQVFLTDAEISPEFIVGEPGDGWTVATTTRMNERRGADGLRRFAKATDLPNRCYREEARSPTSSSLTSGIRSAWAGSTW